MSIARDVAGSTGDPAARALHAQEDLESGFWELAEYFTDPTDPNSIIGLLDGTIVDITHGEAWDKRFNPDGSLKDPPG
jgi:hypothetical protein